MVNLRKHTVSPLVKAALPDGTPLVEGTDYIVIGVGVAFKQMPVSGTTLTIDYFEPEKTQRGIKDSKPYYRRNSRY